MSEIACFPTINWIGSYSATALDYCTAPLYDAFVAGYMVKRTLACASLLWPLLSQAVAQTAISEAKLTSGVPFWWPTTTDLPPGAVPTRDEVMVLLKALYPESSRPPIYDIEAFRFVPLAPGKIHLVVVADFTGRAIFNAIEVIHCERLTCQTGTVFSDANDLDRQLVYIGGEGGCEIITKELVHEAGAETKPIFRYSIYRLQGRELVDVSSRYAEYFTRHLLPEIEETMRKVEGWPDQRVRADARVGGPVCL